MAINPQEYEKFLGHTFVTRQRQIAFAVGDHQWSRWELANVFGLPHFRAAANLTIYLRKAGVKTLDQLFAVSPDELAKIKGLGETAAYVAASILKQEDFNAKQWAGFGADGTEPVTFRTMKNRAKGNGGRRGRHNINKGAGAGRRGRL